MSRGFINLLGPLFTRAFKPGASEVKTARLATVSPANTRVTILTPTSGKKVRIVSCQLSCNNAGLNILEVYFGTGANITTNAGKEVMEVHLGAAVTAFGLTWPDGGGPVGVANEVVSLRVSADITVTGRVVISYREE